MGKPLLTDEMIERARRGEDITGPKMVDAEETKIIRTCRSKWNQRSQRAVALKSKKKVCFNPNSIPFYFGLLRSSSS